MSTRPSNSNSHSPTPTPTPTAPAPPAPAPPHLSSAETQRLESILVAIETSFSDYGLSYYRSSGLLDRFKRGAAWIHISQVLALPPVRALTGVLADLQKAMRIRESRLVKLDETGYQIGRIDAPDVERLEGLEPADWDDLTVYLENIPFTSSSGSTSASSASSFSLSTFISSALGTPVQRIVLPPLYDPSNPPDFDAEEADGEGEGTSQAEAFAAAQAAQRGDGEAGDGPRGGGRKAKGLPKGGGPFKGFAFVVLRSEDDVQKALGEYAWERTERGQEEGVGDEDDEEEDVEMKDASNGKEKGNAKGKGKGKEVDCAEKARRGGMRAISYTRWLSLKKEYLSYRRSLETLLEAHASGELDRLRHPPPAAPTRDRPPHLAASTSASQAAPAPHDSATKRNKRASSPTSPLVGSTSHEQHPSQPPSKRTKRASSPSLSHRLKRIRTPSPGLNLDSDAALDVQGAFPEGCVVWVRNVHEKSSKTSLKALFGRLLEGLQEGSGKGVEFVDYEKGLETCYIRFSSSPLALLTSTHLSTTPTLHLAPTSLAPVSSLSPNSRSEAESALRRPIAVERLTGESERRYWASLPEATRRAARKGAGGKVGLVKEAKRSGEENKEGGGEQGRTREEAAASGGGEGSRKRKKPSKM
ncbi:hypothetical protein JCM5296_003834 [Sporobolomyces johnsonii]